MLNLFLFTIFFVIISWCISAFSKKNISIRNISENGILKVNLKIIICISLIVLIPAIIIGYRNDMTGVDTISYVNAFSDIYGKQYLLYRAHNSFEWFFWGGMYLFKVFSTMRVCFIFYAWLTLFLAGIGVYKLSYKVNPFILNFVFYLLFYQECFNIMRQMVAISIVLISFSYIFEKKGKTFILIIIFAALFHSSAIFCLPMYLMNKKNYNVGMESIKRIIFVGVIIFAFPFILNIVVRLPVLSRYIFYAEGITFDKSFNWLKSILIILPAIVILYIYSRKNKIENELDVKFLLYITFVYVVLLATRMYTNWMFRIALYYQLGSIILGALLSKHNVKNKKKWSVPRVEFFLILYYFLYYIYLNYYNNYTTSALVNICFTGKAM
ncbi:EpsG family protein [bacterium 210702-DFI.5.13]|nr:EpsG family protein [bacterium 210702-DFI.5.13]